MAAPVTPVTIDDDAVHVVAANERRPLVTDEGRESAWVIVGLRGSDRFSPSGFVGSGIGRVHERFRKPPLREQADELECHPDALSRHDPVVPVFASRVPQNVRLALEKIWKETHVVRMVGDDEEIERPRKLHFQTRRRGDFFTPGETIGLVETQPISEGTGIHG